MNLLALRAVDEEKYALHLMDVLFTEEEMAQSCYISSQRSKKKGLDPKRVELLEGDTIVTYVYNNYMYLFFEDCVKKVFGTKEFQNHANAIRRKCTQKCIDKGRSIVKKEIAEAQICLN